MRRAVLTLRVSAEAVRALDQRAAAEARSRSDLARILLTYALRRMPAGWTPEDKP